ncbi:MULTISPECIES: maleylpyruvate isomerase family mycothiol-dependent enzyme [Microbacterium]|uniref:maleylpyruvate isomerase family mycothiol-dependent enzyme n=1 Tax=Microbacterium TaxID=33882 RepID=UPI00249E4970|nr:MULTISPECIES: maleylpyruvate isomerase family mycothiol-dependent enzyme [Microbacterium]WHE37853.1 maleylpyruvate isomerase family mycothiol-dependent enzyme [Microbacterium sp. BDGP8]WRK17486.1 maleylpyruvate isomerase family mycothiol-dependent enzyme [Microbacterium plantarum]
MRASALWSLIHAERQRLHDQTQSLTAEQWRSPALVGSWTLEQTIAHLTAGAEQSIPAWLRSVFSARFDFELHKERGVVTRMGASPAETLARYERAIRNKRRAAGPLMAGLGEVLIHGEEIRRPVGIRDGVPVQTAAATLQWFARHDFTEYSRSRAQGLRLVANDAATEIGQGAEVRGRALSLLVALSGRPVIPGELHGPGAAVLIKRGGAEWKPQREPARRL